MDSTWVKFSQPYALFLYAAFVFVNISMLWMGLNTSSFCRHGKNQQHHYHSSWIRWSIYCTWNQLCVLLVTDLFYKHIGKFIKSISNSPESFKILQILQNISPFTDIFGSARTKKLTKDYFIPLKWFLHLFFFSVAFFFSSTYLHQKISSFPSNILLSLQILGSRFNRTDLSRTICYC